MLTAMIVIALASGLALILSVMLQTTKAESFSAAMGSGSSGEGGRFKPGSKEEWLYKITRFSAIVWAVACVLVAFFAYSGK